MDSKILTLVTVFAAMVAVGFASECCKAYTDLYGNHHESQFCEDYCCLDVSISTFTEGALRSCCSESWRRVPEQLRDDNCISWIKNHVWVPIVSSIVVLGVIIAICTCCCCCGCCACCRNSRPGVVVTGAPVPSHTVVMSSQHTMRTANPVHVGYDQ